MNDSDFSESAARLGEGQHPQELRLGSSGFSKTPEISNAMIRDHVVLWLLDALVRQ
jgi:hypothetical protein